MSFCLNIFKQCFTASNFESSYPLNLNEALNTNFPRSSDEPGFFCANGPLFSIEDDFHTISTNIRLALNCELELKDHKEQRKRALAKMIQNANKAMNEHIYALNFSFNEKTFVDIYSQPSEINLSIARMENLINESDLKLLFSTTQILHSPLSKTVLLTKKVSQGLIAGVFYSRENIQVAQYAADFFKNWFLPILGYLKEDGYQSIKLLCEQLQYQLELKSGWDQQGCSAVFSYIDLKHHLIYTATIGANEANIYRKIKQKVKSIPLSCLRNWSSPKDAERASKAYNNPLIALEWIGHSDHKFLECKKMNFSRAFGYHALNREMHTPLILSKPKITIHEIFQGDVITLASSQIKETFSEVKLVKMLTSSLNSTSRNISNVVTQGGTKGSSLIAITVQDSADSSSSVA